MKLKYLVKKMALRLLPLIDVLFAPLVYPSAWLLKLTRQIGLHRLPIAKHILMHVGVFPIRNHYYEPQFDNRNPSPEFSKDRTLPGIDWNLAGQLSMLELFRFSSELNNIPDRKPTPFDFYFNNMAFEAGDAEYWYQLIRTIKPKRIIEVGSGYSTLMATKAIHKNIEEDPANLCKHICIEPYEMPWLENTDVSVIRKKVEELELSFFSDLNENDILFIDSSHVIKPQGDVLFEYLEILPSLNEGVIVHIHDIFSPKNYLKTWMEDEVRLWNEQYLLEAFLSNNHDWKILGALNYLHHNHYDELKLAAPYLTPKREPGSFYIQKLVQSS